MMERLWSGILNRFGEGVILYAGAVEASTEALVQPCLERSGMQEVPGPQGWSGGSSFAIWGPPCTPLIRIRWWNGGGRNTGCGEPSWWDRGSAPTGGRCWSPERRRRCEHRTGAGPGADGGVSEQPGSVRCDRLADGAPAGAGENGGGGLPPGLQGGAGRSR